MGHRAAACVVASTPGAGTLMQSGVAAQLALSYSLNAKSHTLDCVEASVKNSPNTQNLETPSVRDFVK